MDNNINTNIQEENKTEEHILIRQSDINISKYTQNTSLKTNEEVINEILKTESTNL
jgi:hypothetical protein